MGACRRGASPAIPGASLDPLPGYPGGLVSRLGIHTLRSRYQTRRFVRVFVGLCRVRHGWSSTRLTRSLVVSWPPSFGGGEASAERVPRESRRAPRGRAGPPPRSFVLEHEARANARRRPRAWSRARRTCTARARRASRRRGARTRAPRARELLRPRGPRRRAPGLFRVR